MAGVEVLRIGLGTAVFAGGSRMDSISADQISGYGDLLRMAADAGMVIDTAWVYGPQPPALGAGVEDLIGAGVAAGHLPGRGLIATKGGRRRSTTGDWLAVTSLDDLARDCRESLRRLGVSQHRLYQLHRPLPEAVAPFADQVKTLASLADQGLIANIGLCNVDVAQLRTAEGVLAESGRGVVSVQNQFGIGTGDEQVLRWCESRRVPMLGWYPLDAGNATGPSHSAAVTEIARSFGRTPAQVTLAYLLQKSDVMVPIPGTTSPAHLEENLGALDLVLRPSEIARLDGLHRQLTTGPDLSSSRVAR